MLADVLPIAIFIYGFLGFALRRFFGLGWIATLAGIAVLLGVNLSLERWLPAGLLNGSIAYAPALVTGMLTAMAARARELPVADQLTAAAVALAVSLVFRTLDQAVCAAIPVGSHFIWHILNAVVLGLYLEAALRHGSRAPDKMK
jgi:hypothetical protein